MNFNSIHLQKSALLILYVLGFLLAFSSAIPAYTNSSFLETIINKNYIGIIYSIGSVFSLLALLSIQKLLKKYGNYKVVFFFTVAYFLNFIALATSPNNYVVIFCFLISGSLATVIYFSMDIFLEHNSTDIQTGRIRSVYLTFINLAWLISPWLAGLIIGEYSYRRLYLIVAIIIIPIIIILSRLSDFKDPEYKTFKIMNSIKGFGINKNIKNIICSNFIIQFFYSWMVIYTPIYLHQYIGFDWKTIGIIFSIMLLPFVLMDIPLGYLADKKFGEKEILSLGFIIIAISTIIIPLINSRSFIVWGLVLFITRVGAAMVEVMNETYFFKSVDDKNLGAINLYRVVGPLVYIISPIIATVIIFYTSFNTMFYILGIMMFFGLRYSLTLQDTK